MADDADGLTLLITVLKSEGHPGSSFFLAPPSAMGGEEAPLRFAVLDCEDAAKWDGHAIALSRLLSRAGERWCAPHPPPNLPPLR